MKKIKVKSADAKQRLDKFLATKLKLARTQTQKMIKTGAVLVDGKAVTPHHLLKETEIVEVTNTPKLPDGTSSSVMEKTKPEKFKLEIVAKTPDYLVLNKPAGIPVHPDSRYLTGTLIQEVLKKYPDIKKVGDDHNRYGIIHRLDKDVSGLIVIARNNKMFDCLKEQFKTRSVQKEYIALVHGPVSHEAGTIDFVIDRSKRGPMVARPAGSTGKSAVTEYIVAERFINYTLLRVKIKTGRTHQIRVHFKALGHPVVGDKLYTLKKQKEEKFPLSRLFLHSASLGFNNLKGEHVEFQSDLPVELKKYLTQLK